MTRTRLPIPAAAPLADFLASVAPRRAKFACAAAVLDELLPPWLLAHCEIRDTAAGRLTIRVDHPAEQFELRMRSPDLVAALRARCRLARITEIALTLI